MGGEAAVSGGTRDVVEMPMHRGSADRRHAATRHHLDACMRYRVNRVVQRRSGIIDHAGS